MNPDGSALLTTFSYWERWQWRWSISGYTVSKIILFCLGQHCLFDQLVATKIWMTIKSLWKEVQEDRGNESRRWDKKEQSGGVPDVRRKVKKRLIAKRWKKRKKRRGSWGVVFVLPPSPLSKRTHTSRSRHCLDGKNSKTPPWPMTWHQLPANRQPTGLAWQPIKDPHSHAEQRHITMETHTHKSLSLSLSFHLTISSPRSSPPLSVNISHSSTPVLSFKEFLICVTFQGTIYG